MKKAVSVLLIVLSLLIGFQRVLIVLHYQLNTARIERQYCENKNLSAMTCKGICYVRKALQKTEDKANNSFKVMYQKADMVLENYDLVQNLEVGFERTNMQSDYVAVLYADPLIEIQVPPPLIVTPFS